MTEELFGPADEVYQLTVAPRSDGPVRQGIELLEDPYAVLEALRGFLEEPRNVLVVRRLLRDGYGQRDDPSDPRWLERLARDIATGALTLRRVDDLIHARDTLPSVVDFGELTPTDDEGAEEREQHVRDQMLQCEHHDSDGRDILEELNRIQVVPSKGTVVDQVTVHFKDTGSPPPPSLTASPGGVDVPQNGASGGYTLYPFDAEYTGDVDQGNFLWPAFWRAYQERTNYQVRGALSSVSIEVFNPRQYKLEFKLPPFKSFKTGFELTKDIERSGRRITTADETHVKWERSESQWSPSSLTLDTSSEGYDSRKAPGERRSTDSSLSRTPIESIAFSVDDVEQSVAVLDYIGAILDMYETCMKVVEAIQENAPKVGWYMSFDLQLMQGALAIEWYWKEHTDHRVFQYVDVNVSLTIFKLVFELGIGISGLGFKAQVFAQLEGGLSVSFDAKRDSPELMPGFAVPAKGWIKGALGARFEAGNFFKAEGKGETGIEVVAEIGINRGRSKMFHGDFYANWTGIVVTAEVSGGLFGLGGKRTWTRTLVGPTRMLGGQWPKPEPYRPPHVSKTRIKSVLQRTITKGLNVRVIRTVSGLFNDEHWTPAQIAETLANTIDQHRTWHRTDKVLEGLSHAIRGDLDEMGARFGRDYIEESDFLGYVRGSQLQGHLDDAISPARDMAARAGA
ncbi:MAG TPA: hypothetical protein RMH99_01965 [Sandaracinaceae bacterium LLY-WYZ-13_1]|nr:hypothetical protein [Sandaracinaceae bacterium LLY-WYZ-13_1]